MLNITTANGALVSGGRGKMKRGVRGQEAGFGFAAGN